MSENMPYKKAFEYDIGLVCMMNYNIGNNFGNYALWRYLTDAGYSVVVIGSTGDMEWHSPYRQVMWMNVPYPEKALAPEEGSAFEFYIWNKKCRFFIVGSDQTFRYKHAYAMNSYPYLEFANDGKYKASYGSSFGTDVFEGCGDELSEISYYLNRFNLLSVREESGQRILKESFGMTSEKVLDPVFLLDKKHYEGFIKKGMGRLPANSYTFAYILDDCELKQDIILCAARSFSDGVHAAMLERCWEFESDKKERLSIITKQKNEEWIAGIYGSEFVVTDSFHCVCFCILFEKQFCVVYDPDNWRGYARIKNILHEFDLDDRHIKDFAEYELADFKNHKIDYKKVRLKLQEMLTGSKAYLKRLLEEADRHQGEYTDMDKVRSLVYRLNMSIKNLELSFEDYKIQTEIKKNNEIMKMKSEAYLKMITGRMTYRNIVAWGAGDCFERNYPKLSKVYSLKYVCDNNPELWDKKTKDGTVIISPQKLKEFDDCFVVIMVDNGGASIKIAQQLLKMGITSFDHIENWLREIGEIR